MSAKIYYFSGTGNSLRIAQEVAAGIGAELESIVKFNNAQEVTDNNDIIGFIYPVYYADMPLFFKEFIKKLKIKNATYIFAITNMGQVSGVALQSAERLLNKKGFNLNAGYEVLMPDNSILFKSKKSDIEKFLAEFQDKVNIIVEKINKKDTFELPNKSYELYRVASFFSKFIFDYVFGVRKKKNDDTCNHCGICESVCPVGNIMLVDNIVFRNQCVDCFACIHWCTKRSISFGKLKPGRRSHYVNPEVNIKEIIAQK